jgi:hypothetical protein
MEENDCGLKERIMEKSRKQKSFERRTELTKRRKE